MDQFSRLTDAEWRELEPLYESAIDFARAEERMSISKMQRKFMIGYNRAARLCERLEQDGVLKQVKGEYSWRRADSATLPQEQK